MSCTLRIVLPLPDRALNPHAKGNWRPKHAATKKARAMAETVCAQAMRDAKVEGFQRAEYRLTFYCDTLKARITKGYCPRDHGNAVQSVKAYIDGCIDAGILPDDSIKYLDLGPVRILPSGESGKRAEVVIEFVENDNVLRGLA